MEFRYLTSFLTLAEELHFGRAAERLHISQPSLSQQLQKLERHVGVRLVARTSHSVRLTPAGEAFRRESVRLLAQADLAVEAARWAGSGATGHLRICFNYPAGQRVLAPTLTLLEQRHPEIRTSLVPRASLAQLVELREGRVDVALVFGTVGEQGLCQRPIFTLPVVGICSRRHPLATHAAAAPAVTPVPAAAGATAVTVRWPELARYRCLLPSRRVSPAMNDAIRSAARPHGLDFGANEVFDDGDAAVVTVASSDAIIFASAARAESVAASGLATLAVVDPVPQVTVHAIWRDGDPNPAVPLFLDAIDELRGELAG